MKKDNRKNDHSMEPPPREDASLPEEPGPEEAAPPPKEAAGELEELKSRYAYLAAEFDNYRKRAAREREALVSFGNERLLRAILPFLDNLERAMAQAAASGSIDGLQAGVRLTYDQVLSELKKFGLEQISSEGEAFDPARHEAIAQAACEGKEEGTVLSEASKGYLLNGRLLRPAQVIVAQAPPRAAGRENGPDADGSGLDN